MSRQQVPLGFSSIMVPSGSRVAYLCSGAPQSYDLLVAFLAAGLAQGERCVAAVPECPTGFWEQALSQLGIDMRSLHPGQLHILTGNDLTQALDGQWGCARRLVDEHEGSQVRICTSLNRFMHDVHAVASLDALYANPPRTRHRLASTMLCAIAVDDIRPNTLQDCLDLHDFATDGAGLNTVLHRDTKAPNRQATGSTPTGRSSALRFVSDTPVLRTPDEFEVYTSIRVGRLADLLIDLGHRRMVLDMGDTTFIDAAGVRTLLTACNRMRELGGSLAVLDHRAPHRKIYRLIGLQSVIPILETLPESIDLVTRGNPCEDAPLPDPPGDLKVSDRA